MNEIRISAPLLERDVLKLKAGDRVLISGTIITARDAAHMRLLQLIKENKPLPIRLEGQVIYYAGPSPAPEGRPIGACGPTTSYRMDKLTPPLLALGLKGMIGKGDRSDDVIKCMVEFGAVYFAAVGGAGALIASAVQAAEVIAFEDLGPEALMALTVVDFPAFVAIDAKGADMYRTEPIKYRR